MWFLIKGTFYCTATLVALSFLAAPPAEEKDGASFDMGAAITAASGAYEYVTSPVSYTHLTLPTKAYV
jgi:hypothetical protein